MFIQIPSKNQNHKGELQKIEISNLSDKQLAISISIFESKIENIYKQIRIHYNNKNQDCPKELNFKAVFNEKILNELYLERNFRENDTVIIFNKLFDDIYSAQINNEGLENNIEKYEGICNDIDFKSINMLKNRK